MSEAVAAVAAEAAPPPKAPKYVKRGIVHVPAGHVMPKGEVIQRGFDVTVVAGARWHPEWTEPRIVVQAYQFLSMGDALCWSGASAKAFPLNASLAALADEHGQPAKLYDHVLAEMGLDMPAEREPLAAFIPARASKTLQ